jgi:hypothetical protein
MHERKACLVVAAALVAALAASARAVETPFQDQVNAALAPQGAIKAAISDQKKLSVDEAARAQDELTQDDQNAQVEADVAHGPGGGGPGPRPGPQPNPRPEPRPQPQPRPEPRPQPRPEPRPQPRPEPGPHPGPQPGPRPGPHPTPRPPDHPTHPLPPDHRHGDWGRWHDHPGWGHGHDGWDWDRWGRPHWWGWVIWTGERRAECLDYYGMELHDCKSACAADNDQCVQDCAQYGDPACAEQCGVNSRYCRESCDEDYDQRVSTCPPF